MASNGSTLARGRWRASLRGDAAARGFGTMPRSSGGGRGRRALAAVGFALAMSACSTAPPTGSPSVSGGAPLAPGSERTLERYRWRLESATSAGGARIDAVSPAAGRAFTFAFAGSQVLVDGGCNAMRGGFLIPAEGKLAFGRMASTMRACDGTLMQADAALAKLVAEPMAATLAPGDAPRLRLVTPASDALVLVGELTPEARYGPPTVAFLDVAAARVPCNHPLIRDATCLQVRDRAFDAQGLPAGSPGPWRAFYGTIEGYTHQEGVRNVLRVKRFARSPAPADGSSYLYVLDLVVESEAVKR